MAKIYAKLIQEGRRTIEDVPAHLKDDVLAILENTQA